MNLHKVVEIVIDELANDVSFYVNDSTLSESGTEASGNGFSFWKCSNLENLELILRRRLRMPLEGSARKWLQQQLDLVEHALAAGDGELYQGYAVVGKVRKDFVILPTAEIYYSASAEAV